MTLGSLFDGIGGFPLAAARYGIKTLWTSDIDPACEAVTKVRFPNAVQLGDITKINGREIEPVDIISGGSPCQDLSVAGKRAGLEGARSGLFMEMVRIIREMRDATGKLPRYVLWENVPGAYSSNGGEDFRAVVEEFCRCADRSADVPRPARWGNAGCVMGNEYSFAWRTLDAQFWGVPQRRRRIYAVLDLGGQRAPKILFVENGLRGDPAESGTAGEGAAGDAEGSVGRGVLFEPMSALEENWAESSVKNALRAGASKSSHAVCYPIDLIRESRGAFEAYDEDAKICGSLKQSDNKGSQVVCYPINTMVATRWKADDGRTTFGIGDNGDPQFTLGAAHEHAVCYPIDSHQQDSRFRVCENRTPTAIVYSARNGQVDNSYLTPEAAQTLNCMHDQQIILHKKNRRYIIRRLTPLECERLQGFPDGWTAVPYRAKPMADSARYGMLGNTIAVPCAEYVFRRIREATDD